MKECNRWWYERVYYRIITRAKDRGLDKTKLTGYYEMHHIFPRCLGGTNNTNNLVLLTYREHVLCHIILVGLFNNNPDLIRAASMMMHVTRQDDLGNDIIIKLKNSKVAESIKLEAARLNRGENHPSYGKTISEDHKRILSKVNSHPKTKETIEKMRKSQTGKKASKESKLKMSKSHKGLKIHTESRKQFLSNRWKLNNPRKHMDMTGSNNPSSKKVMDPNGKIHESIKRCAKENNISYETLRKMLRLGIGDYKLID